MDWFSCWLAASAAWDALPPTVRPALCNVRLRVSASPPPGWPPGASAAFEGTPAADDLEADDLGDDGPSLASGRIVLIAPFLVNAEAVTVALWHEVAHALGYDESEVSLMGLSDRCITDADGTFAMEQG